MNGIMIPLELSTSEIGIGHITVVLTIHTRQESINYGISLSTRDG